MTELEATHLILVLALMLSAVQSRAGEFKSSTARIAAWNLEGFDPITDERLAIQARGIALLDAEVLMLVEVNPDSVLQKLKTLLEDEHDLCYNFTVKPQDAKQNIAVRHKCGVAASNARFIPNSDLGVQSARKALVIEHVLDVGFGQQVRDGTVGYW